MAESKHDSNAAMPPTLQLEEIELLKLENLQLKLGQTEQEKARLLRERQVLAKQIEEHHGIDGITNYAIDIATGRGRRIDVTKEDGGGNE